MRKSRPKSAVQLARAQLDGARRWGETWVGSSSICVCRKCDCEFHVTAECDPCAFCNDCKDEVLDILAVRLVSLLPARKRKAARR